MPPSRTGRAAGALLAAAALAACGGAARSAVEPMAAPSGAPPSGVAQARADSARLPYTEADIRFMASMIGHHAQAIRMARLAPTHGASAPILTLAARITNAQRDEIATMQQWLRDRRQPVPEVDAEGTVSDMPSAHGTGRAGHAGHGAEHAAMPGMLTPEQMRELDAARGAEFDRLFLVDMIQHHRGAVAMVRELFGTYGAGQDESVFRLATDINVDQETEIARMERMLVELLLGDASP